MQIKVFMDEAEILIAVVQYIEQMYGVSVSSQDLNVSVKSKQNYKSEWEQAAIKIECSATAKRA